MKTEQEIGGVLDAVTWAVLKSEEEVYGRDPMSMTLADVVTSAHDIEGITALKWVALGLSWATGRSCPNQAAFDGKLADILRIYNNRHNTPVKKRRRKKK